LDTMATYGFAAAVGVLDPPQAATSVATAMTAAAGR